MRRIIPLRITKVYTRQGDQGETRLGGGQKVAKDNIRIETFGTVDELNTSIGIALVFGCSKTAEPILETVQHLLFTLGADLSVLKEDQREWQMQAIEQKHIALLEGYIDELNAQLQPLEEFVLPGGGKTAVFLHQARCVCRRAERLAVRLAGQEEIGEFVVPFLNRLSDLLFVLSRYENKESKYREVYWKKDKI